jgi:hypothetical protein
MDTGKENTGEQKSFWIYYKKDNEKVKEQFLSKDYDSSSATGMGCFDGLFCFLIEAGFFGLFNFRPDCRKRVMIPLAYFLSLYGLKVICELDSLNRVSTQLFRNRALLELIGFTGVHFEKGFSNRNKGKHLPFNITTMGKLFGDFSTGQTDKFFINSLQTLAEHRFIHAGTYILDATPLHVSNSAKTYEGTGSIVKDGDKKSGYKLITLKYARAYVEKDEPEIFVAAILVPLNHHESRYMIPIVQQAVSNIGKGRIKQVVMDRGFVNGEDLYRLKYDFNIDFIIYSKSNMDVTDELKKKAEDYKERQRKQLPLPASYFLQEDQDTQVYGFNNLQWFWTYGKSEHQQQVKEKIYKKDKNLKTHPISGGLITKYKGKERTAAITFLSSKRFGKIFTPLVAVNLYKKRQYTENEGYRELKQGYNIGRFPSRKFNGIYLHVIFTMVMFNYISCYKTKKGGKIAFRGLRSLHRDMTHHGIIIYSAPYFGVFDTEEVFGWLGFKGKGLSPPRFLLMKK